MGTYTHGCTHTCMRTDIQACIHTHLQRARSKYHTQLLQRQGIRRKIPRSRNLTSTSFLFFFFFFFLVLNNSRRKNIVCVARNDLHQTKRLRARWEPTQKNKKCWFVRRELQWQVTLSLLLSTTDKNNSNDNSPRPRFHRVWLSHHPASTNVFFRHELRQVLRAIGPLSPRRSSTASVVPD